MLGKKDPVEDAEDAVRDETEEVSFCDIGLFKNRK